MIFPDIMNWRNAALYNWWDETAVVYITRNPVMTNQFWNVDVGGSLEMYFYIWQRWVLKIALVLDSTVISQSYQHFKTAMFLALSALLSSLLATAAVDGEMPCSRAQAQQ